MNTKNEKDEYDKIISKENIGVRMLQGGLMSFFPGIFLIIISTQQIPNRFQQGISEVLFFGILVLTMSSILLIYGAYLFGQASKEVKKFPLEYRYQKAFEQVSEEVKIFGKAMSEALGYPSESKTRVSSSLKCPDCGAPLETQPPCKCSYCGRLLE